MTSENDTRPEAPERIFAFTKRGDLYGAWTTDVTLSGTEYVRADALRPAASEGEEVELPRNCPGCNLNWNLVPPVNHDDETLRPDGTTNFSPTNGYRCVSCKSTYRIALSAAPKPPQSPSLALAEENRVLREALDQLIKATTNLLIHVDTSTCGGALLTFYHEAKSAKDQARAALSTPSPHPHSQREEAFEAFKSAAALALEYWAHRMKRYKNRSPRWVEEMRAAIARAESCK